MRSTDLRFRVLTGLLAVVSMALLVLGIQIATGPDHSDDTVDVLGKNQGKPAGGGGTKGSFELRVTASAASLHPGGSRQLPLKLENTYSFDVRISEVTVTVDRVSVAGCATNDLLIAHTAAGTDTWTPSSGTLRPPDLGIRKNGEIEWGYPIRLVANPSNACQNATFHLTVIAHVVKA